MPRGGLYNKREPSLSYMERQQLREREAKRPRYDSPKRDTRGAYGDDDPHRQYNSELQMEAVVAMSQAARGRTAEAEAGASLGVANGPVTAHQAPVHNPLAAALPAIVGRLASGGPRAQAGERAHSSPTGLQHSNSYRGTEGYDLGSRRNGGWRDVDGPQSPVRSHSYGAFERRNSESNSHQHGNTPRSIMLGCTMPTLAAAQGPTETTSPADRRPVTVAAQTTCSGSARTAAGLALCTRSPQAAAYLGPLPEAHRRQLSTGASAGAGVSAAGSAQAQALPQPPAQLPQALGGSGGLGSPRDSLGSSLDRSESAALKRQRRTGFGQGLGSRKDSEQDSLSGRKSQPDAGHQEVSTLQLDEAAAAAEAWAAAASEAAAASDQQQQPPPPPPPLAELQAAPGMATLAEEGVAAAVQAVPAVALETEPAPVRHPEGWPSEADLSDLLKASEVKELSRQAPLQRLKRDLQDAFAALTAQASSAEAKLSDLQGSRGDLSASVQVRQDEQAAWTEKHQRLDSDKSRAAADLVAMQARPTPMLTLENVSEPESSGDEGMPQAPSVNGVSTSSRSEMTTATSESEDSETQVNSLVSQQLRSRRRGETEFGHSARAVLRAEQAARLHYACGRQQKVRMDAVRQVFVDNRQKAMAAHEDSLAPGGPHIMDMTVTNGGGRPRQAIATLPAQLLRVQTTDFSFYWRNIISFEQDKAMLLERLHKRKAPGLAAQWLQLQSWKQKQQEFEDYLQAQGLAIMQPLNPAAPAMDQIRDRAVQRICNMTAVPDQVTDPWDSHVGLVDTRWGFVEDVRQADQLERLGLELDAQDQRRFGEAFCKFHKGLHRFGHAFCKLYKEFGKIAAEMGNKSRVQCNHIYNDYKTADWFAPYLRKYNSLKRRLKARTRPFLAAGLGEPAPRARAAAGRATAVAIGVEAEAPGRGRGRRTGRTGPRQATAAAVAVVEGRVVAAAAASGAATPSGPGPMDLALSGWTPHEEEKLIEGAKLWPANWDAIAQHINTSKTAADVQRVIRANTLRGRIHAHPGPAAVPGQTVAQQVGSPRAALGSASSGAATAAQMAAAAALAAASAAGEAAGVVGAAAGPADVQNALQQQQQLHHWAGVVLGLQQQQQQQQQVPAPQQQQQQQQQEMQALLAVVGQDPTALAQLMLLQPALANLLALQGGQQAAAPQVAQLVGFQPPGMSIEAQVQMQQLQELPGHLPLWLQHLQAGQQAAPHLLPPNLVSGPLSSGGEAGRAGEQQQTPEAAPGPVQRPFSGKRSPNFWQEDEKARFLEAYQKYGTDWPKVQQAVGTKDLTQTKNYYSNSKTRLKLDMLPLALGAKLPKSSPRSKASSSPPAGSPLGSGPAAAVHGELQPLVQQRQGRLAAAASGAATSEFAASYGLHPSPDIAAFHQQQAGAGRQEKSGEGSQGPSASARADMARAPSPAPAAAAGQLQSFSALLLEGSQSPSPGGARQRSTPEAEGQPGSSTRDLAPAGLPFGSLGGSVPRPGSPGGGVCGPGQAAEPQQPGSVTGQPAGPQPGHLTAVGEASAASTGNFHGTTRSAAEGPAGGAAQPAADPSADREELYAAGEGRYASEAPREPLSQAQAQVASQQAEQIVGPHVIDTVPGHREQEHAHAAPSSAPPATLLRVWGAPPHEDAAAVATASATPPNRAAEATALPQEPAPMDFEMGQAQQQQPVALAPQGGHGLAWGQQPDLVSEDGPNPEVMDVDQGGGGSTPESGAGSLQAPPAPPLGNIVPQPATLADLSTAPTIPH
eukprot:jgi/Astpho2/7118/fgenesh1_pg.00110_%23_9_t